MNKTVDQNITESSGNVFADLGLENAEELHAKGMLALTILGIIDDRQLTQSEAAEFLGTDQSHISRLKRGHIEGFTFDRLLNWLTKFDRNIQLSIKPKPKHQEKACIQVAL